MTADDLMRLINRYVEACDDLGEGLFEKPLTTTDALHAKATALHGQILDEVYRLHALAAAQPPAAMPGWQWVPVEPTQAMCAAAVKFANGNAVYKNVAAEALKIEEAIYGEAYAAMLAAAPQPPAAPAQAGPIPGVTTDAELAGLEAAADAAGLSVEWYELRLELQHLRTARQAVARALLLSPGDTEAAIAAVAQAMGLPVEAVREVVEREDAPA